MAHLRRANMAHSRRANRAHTRQSRLDSGLNCQVKALEKLVPWCLRTITGGYRPTSFGHHGRVHSNPTTGVPHLQEKRTCLGPCSMPLPWVLGRPQGDGPFLIIELPLWLCSPCSSRLTSRDVGGVSRGVCAPSLLSMVQPLESLQMFSSYSLLARTRMTKRSCGRHGCWTMPASAHYHWRVLSFFFIFITLDTGPQKALEPRVE